EESNSLPTRVSSWPQSCSALRRYPTQHRGPPVGRRVSVSSLIRKRQPRICKRQCTERPIDVWNAEVVARRPENNQSANERRKQTGAHRCGIGVKCSEP